MAQFVRYYEHMRPRYTNPTFNSSHVGTSMGMFLAPNPSNNGSQSHVKLERYANKDQISNYNMNYSYKPAQVNNQYISQKPKQNLYDFTPSTLQHQRTKSHSKFQNYGTSSLSSLPKQISDIDIYEKQTKKYNIISVKPIQHKQTIKKYPKYHLQNLDSNFYKKLQLEGQYSSVPRYDQVNRFGQIDPYQKAQKYQAINNTSNPENYQQNGSKYQIDRQNMKQKNVQKQSDKFSNNMNRQNFNENPNKIQQRQDSQTIRANFRAKMLNNVDELGGLI